MIIVQYRCVSPDIPMSCPVPLNSDILANLEKDTEHDAYKTRAGEVPPPELDPCDKLRWEIKREEDVVKAMEAWDAKWDPGKHATAIQQRKQGIENRKQQLKNQCGDS